MCQVKNRNHIFLYLLLVLSLLVNGCAGGIAARKAITPLKEGVLDRFTNLVIEAQNNENVPITSNAKERIINLITMKIKEKYPSRFKTINGTSTEPLTLHANIHFTKYNRGECSTRTMRCGIGKIYIDEDVNLKDEKQGLQAKYEVNKNFAWGRVHGGTTRIEDVEEGFADAIVAILMEEKEPETKKKMDSEPSDEN